MRKRMEDNLAMIIFSLPEKSLKFWVLNVAIQAAQLLEPGAYLFKPVMLIIKNGVGGFHTQTGYRTSPCVFCGSTTLVQFYQYSDWFYTVLLTLQLFSGQPRVSGLLAYAQIWCPMVVTVSVESLRNYHPTTLTVLSALSIISSTFIWALRVLVIKQDYLSCNAKLSSIKSTLRLVLFMAQSALVFFPSTEKTLMSLVGISLGLSLVMLVLSTSIFQNVDEELQYLHYLKCLFAATFYGSILLAIHTPQMQYMLVLTPVALVILERLEALKFLFQVKYNFLLERIIKIHSQEDLIVMLEVLGTDRTTIYEKPGVRRGRKLNYWTNKSIGFGFYVKARSVCMRLCVKRASQIGKDITIGQLLEEETYTLIQSLMQKKVDSKCNLIPIVLSYQFLKRDLVVTALSIQASIQEGSDFNTRVLKKVLKMQISHAFEIKDRTGSPYRISEGFCCLGTSVVSSKITEVIRAQKFFENFLKKLIRLSQQTTLLTSKLINKTIPSNDTIQAMIAQSATKAQIQGMIDSLGNAATNQIVACFYIYYKHFCSQKFSVFHSLSQHLNTLENIPLGPSAYDMVCLVSATKNNMGRILTANIKMAEFFRMNFQHIKHGLVHIEDILPAPLAQVHNKLIIRAIETGESKLIGKENQFYVVTAGTVYPVEFRVKCQPLDEGINFSCQLRVIDRESFILFDKDNQVLGFSQNAKQVLPKKKLDCRFVHQVFHCLKQCGIGNSINKHMASSSYRNTLSETNFNVEVKFYDSADFDMGICEFTRKETSEFNNPSHQVSNRMIGQTQNSFVGMVPSTENQEFIKSEIRITTMPLNDRRMPGITILLCTYGIILVISTFSFYMVLMGMVTKSQNISRFTSLFYDNNLEGTCLTLDRIHRLRHALNTGDYPVNQTIRGIEMSTFVLTQTQAQLGRLNRYRVKLLDAIKTIPAEFVEILNRREIKLGEFSGVSQPISLTMFMSTLSSEHLQINGLTEVDFQEEWDQIASVIDSLADTAIQAMAKFVRTPISEQVAIFRQDSILYSRVFLVMVETVTLIGVAVFLVILHRIFEEKTKHLQLLLQLDGKFFRQKLETNRNIATLLRQTAKSSLSNIKISEHYQTVEFTCLGHQKRFSRESIEVVDPNAINNPQSSGRTVSPNSKKFLDNKSLNRRQYLCLTVAVFTLVPAACLMAISCVKTCSQILAVENFYQGYMQSNTKVYISATAILNIDTLKIINSSKNTFMNITIQDFFEQSVSDINTRETDSMLIGFVPLVSSDNSKTKLIEDHLYLSKCSDPNDNTCKQIFSGSLTRGIPSALLAFTSAAISLYDYLRASTSPYSSYPHQMMQSLLQMYTFYLRNLIKTGQFALGLADCVYETNLSQLDILLQLSLVTQVLMLALSIRFAIRSRRHIRQLKKQIFTFFPVDILSTNINFKFQLLIQGQLA